MAKKIPISELKVGMYVSGLEKDDPSEVLTFMNNLLVKSEEDIKRFIENGFLSAHVELVEAHASQPIMAPPPPPADVAPEPEPEPVPEPEAEAVPKPVTPHLETPKEPVEEPVHAVSAPPAPPLPRTEASETPTETTVEAALEEYDEELHKAKDIRGEAEALVRDFLGSIREGGEIKTEKVHATVEGMVDSIFRNQDALSSLSRLKTFDDYTFGHCVNVSILSLALGRDMGFDKETLHDLGVGAILHDVGKVLVPEKIFKKRSTLTDPEMVVMRTHSDMGGDLLSKNKELKESSVLVAYQHHEKFDGTGYSQKLAGEEIHLFGRIAAVADVYDAMTSQRWYQKSMLPNDALKKMYHKMRGTNFEPEIVDRLIKCLGIYPIGTFVELNTGEIAIIRLPNHSHPSEPLVLMYFDNDMVPVPKPYELDLKDDPKRWIVRSKNPSDSGSVSAGLVL